MSRFPPRFLIAFLVGWGAVTALAFSTLNNPLPLLIPVFAAFHARDVARRLAEQNYRDAVRLAACVLLIVASALVALGQGLLSLADGPLATALLGAASAAVIHVASVVVTTILFRPTDRLLAVTDWLTTPRTP
jgi:hypothetical protein